MRRRDRVVGGPFRRNAGREDGLITGYLISILIVFLVLGLAANEVGQIIVAKVHASNAAEAAAQAGAESFLSTHNRSQARARAQAAAIAVDPGIQITAFSVRSDGTTTVTVAKTARTLIVQHISVLRHFGVQRSTETVGPPSS
jgi:Flp pilus assembly protein TadG